MVTAFAPASVGNITVGFDVLGMAIANPGDEVTVQFNDRKEVRIVEITGDGGKLPLAAEKNTATVAIISLLQHLGSEQGMDVTIHKKMPFGSGLGSSSASAVAGAYAANELLGAPFTKNELITFALDGEAIASGGRHADNVAPCMLGGITLIRGYNPLDIITLPVPDNLHCSVIYPEIEILTKAAREILPKEVPMKDAISQIGNIAGFVSALYQNDLALLSRCMSDTLAEPYRATLLPDFEKVRNAALYGGALSFGISGSGPSMFAFSDSAAKAGQVGELMKKALDRQGVGNMVFVSKVNEKGVVII